MSNDRTPSSPSGRGAAASVIGDFAIIAKLGQGGMGVVYKARQQSLDRTVALKVLSPAVANDAKFTERFQREARASAKLNHPNIVGGIAVGRDDATGQWYFAMEFVDGPSLKQVLARKGKLVEAHVVAIALDMAQALDCAHKHGFVHRDIKPDNILVNADGLAKLADLGLAKRVNADGDDTTLTQAGQAIGTPAYMAPEQIRGDRDSIDIRTDIYSLGATLFHLVTGRPPYEGKSSAVVMSNHLTKKVPFAQQVNPEVSERFSRLIARMMQKEREGRVQSPADLLREIEKLSVPDHEPVRRAGPRAKSPRTSTGQMEEPPVGVPPARKTLMVIAAVIAAVVLLGLAAFFGQKQKAADEVVEATPSADVRPAPVTAASVPAATVKPSPAAPAPAAPSPPAAPKAPLGGDDDVREEYARRRLAEIKRRQTDERLDGGAARKLYDEFIASYGSTRAGKEAAEIVQQMPAAAEPALAPAAAKTEPPTAPIIAAKAGDTARPTDEALIAYHGVAAEVFAALRAQQFAAAAGTLTKALANPALAAVRGEMQRDFVCVKLAEAAAAKTALDGASRLADKRPFSFWKTDGKEVKVGAGTKNSVASVKDDVINIEQDLGGGLATSRIKLDQVAPRTIYELSRIGLPPGPESELKLAMCGTVALSGGAELPAPKQILEHLDNAARQGGPAKELAEHLRARVAFLERELDADAVLKRVDPLISGKRWDAAEAALQQFKRDYLGTQALKRLQAEVDKRWTQVEGELHPLKPGLWASFWAGEGQKPALSRVELKLAANFEGGAPAPGMPADWFNIRYGGILRIEREGNYHFGLFGDDYIGLYIDGKLLGEAGTPWIKSASGAGLELGKEVEVVLKKGDHALRAEFREALGNAGFMINWLPPGGAWAALPPDVLFYDSRKTEEYEHPK